MYFMVLRHKLFLWLLHVSYVLVPVSNIPMYKYTFSVLSLSLPFRGLRRYEQKSRHLNGHVFANVQKLNM